MTIRRAVITAASPSQRQLPLQTLIDQNGEQRSLLRLLVEEALSAGVEEIAVVVAPGDAELYRAAAGEQGSRLCLIEQKEPRGYAHAVACAREFAASEPFLHMISDHVFLSHSKIGCARQVVEIAAREQSAISAVQATRESRIGRFGTVAGPIVEGKNDLYRVTTVIEKPTPTEAEQKLFASGLRAGHYLAFFGIHVLTPIIFELIETSLGGQGRPSLSAALAELARREQYLAYLLPGRRFDVGARYGVLVAQLALALDGSDREVVLAEMLELLALREQDRALGARVE